MYTAEFWKRAYELVEKRPRECQRCGVLDNEPEYRGGRLRGQANVRLVLLDGDKENTSPGNLGMGCVRCFPLRVENRKADAGAPPEQATIPK